MKIDGMAERVLAQLDEHSQPDAVKTALNSLRSDMAKLDEVSRGLVVMKAKEILKPLGLAPAATIDLALAAPTKAEAQSQQFWPDDRPAPHEADIAEVLTKVSGCIARYMVLPPGAADTVALWVTHT